MNSKFSNEEVLKLLTGLKTTETKYPSDMIRWRRDMYIEQVAVMVVSTKAGGNEPGSSVGAFSTSVPFKTQAEKK
jgi:hypothetical protein